MNFDWLNKLFDKYSVTARLYPALLTLAPLIWSAIVIFPDLTKNIPHTTALTFATGCLLYFLASIARSRGKFAEVNLVKKWGALPTTILLRHQDQRLNQFTKGRYHSALSSLSGLTIPSAAEELNAPLRADDIYRSATQKLLEKRRGAQYGMIYNENASYGFRRNLYGLKPVAIVINLLAILATIAGWLFVTSAPYDYAAFTQSAFAYPCLPILILVDVVYFLVWVWAIGQRFVLQAGMEYAQALLRSLD